MGSICRFVNCTKVETWTVTQAPQACWSAGGRQKRRWGNGIVTTSFFHYPTVSAGDHPLFFAEDYETGMLECQGSPNLKLRFCNFGGLKILVSIFRG